MTPTCNTCETKFPGKETCKLCGNDPNGPANVDWKIAQAKVKRQLDDAKLLPAVAPPLEVEDWQRHLVSSGLGLKTAVRRFDDVGKAARKASLSLSRIAKMFQVPPRFIGDPERLKHERRAQRALVRSLQSSKTSGRPYKHGRVGVR